jgi:hypothetical protein
LSRLTRVETRKLQAGDIILRSDWTVHGTVTRVERVVQDDWMVYFIDVYGNPCSSGLWRGAYEWNVE